MLKGIYVLMINKIIMYSSVSVIFVGLFSKRNRKQLSSCLYRVIETLVKVWENSRKLWKHLPAARVPTAFLVLPNLHALVFLQLDRNTENVFYFLIVNHLYKNSKRFAIYREKKSQRVKICTKLKCYYNAFS